MEVEFSYEKELWYALLTDEERANANLPAWASELGEKLVGLEGWQFGATFYFSPERDFVRARIDPSEESGILPAGRFTFWVDETQEGVRISRNRGSRDFPQWQHWVVGPEEVFGALTALPREEAQKLAGEVLAAVGA